MASNEIKISEVRSCSAQSNDDNIKEKNPLEQQIIKLKPINQLTSSPVPKQIIKKIVHKTVGNTTIRLMKPDDPKTGRYQTIDGRQFVLKKITKENIQKSPKPAQQKVLTKHPNEEVRFFDQSFKTYATRKPDSNGQRPGPKSASMPQTAQKPITIEGLSPESVSQLPPQVIAFIKKLQSENTMLKRMLMDFRNETVGIANHLLKFSHEINSSITVTKSPAVGAKRKCYPPTVAQQPEQKKLKKTIRMPKFPINSVGCLSTFENDLKIEDFQEFVFQRLESHLKSRNDITQENLFDSVLSSIINVDVLGEISYDQEKNSISSYQLCFKTLEKFRDFYSQLLGAFSMMKFRKAIDRKEIEDFLQRKLLTRGKILQYQKNTEKGSSSIVITKIKINESQREKSDSEVDSGGPTFRWVDDSDNEAIE